MAFKTIPGIKGKIFIPEEGPLRHRKHPCPDCYTCQQCGDDRCRVCREDRADPECPSKECGLPRRLV